MDVQVIKIITRYEIKDGDIGEVISKIADDIRAKKHKDPNLFLPSAVVNHMVKEVLEGVQKSPGPLTMQDRGICEYVCELGSLAHLQMCPEANSIYNATHKISDLEDYTPEAVIETCKAILEDVRNDNHVEVF